MVRYEGGRPSLIGKTESELLYYFNRLAEKSRRYTLRECAYILGISRQTISSRVLDIAKLCKENKEYEQSIKNRFSPFKTLSEALDSFDSALQPINPEDDTPDVIGTITNLDINIRDIAFNIIEIGNHIKYMNEILNKNIEILNCMNLNQSTDKQGNISESY